jgi:hypothetical protein
MARQCPAIKPRQRAGVFLSGTEPAAYNSIGSNRDPRQLVFWLNTNSVRRAGAGGGSIFIHWH